MQRLNVLISGAGIAGCSLAYWLGHYGHCATVVERGAAIRSSGAPVDVRGPAAQIAERMGIGPRLREAGIRIAGITVLDRAGRRSTRIDLDVLKESIAPRDIELPRGDLSTILYESSRDHAEFIFADSIRSLAQDGQGIHVTFERSPPRRFDLVIGADGLHSTVRRLAFGPEESFVRHAGLYVATLPLPRACHSGREMIMLNAPGKCVALHPSRETPLAFFIFWYPQICGFDHFDGEQHKHILETTFADVAWKVPELLAAVRASRDELYFDSVSRVELTRWASGRTALVGDAASCVSLFGDGSTLAIAGAYALATALGEAPMDHEAAFRRYQAQHGELVARRQKTLTLLASFLVPRTQVGIFLRNRIVGMTRAYTGAKRISRHFRRVVGSPAEGVGYLDGRAA